MINLNKNTVKDANDIYKMFASELNFPDYFGNNIDALHDCLCEVSSPVFVDIDDEEYLKGVFPKYTALVNMLNDTAEEKSNLVLAKHINMEHYKRKAHYEYFKSLRNPHVGVTVNVDVTELVSFCKEKKVSFYLTMMHAAALAADAVPQLRQRVTEDGIVEFSQCASSHTESMEDGTYCYCTLYHHMSFVKYIEYARAKQAECRKNGNIVEDDETLSYCFVSSLPWLNYSAFVQPTDGAFDSNPRITWGRYEKNEKGRLMLPLTLLCNHAIVDGLHLSKFYENLEKEIEKIVMN